LLIKKCYMSGLKNEKRVFIRVQQQNDLDTVIQWNQRNDIETEGFNVQSSAEVFFDEQGKFFIIDGNEIVIAHQHART